MTRKEAIKILKELAVWTEQHGKTRKAIDMALEALEQEPCEDCISREKALELAENSYHLAETKEDLAWLYENNLKALPPVQPKQEPTTKNDLGVDCISRQSVLDKIQRLINAEQNNIDENGDYMNYARERVNAYEAIQFFVENDCLCPSVTPQEPRWIPVSERLPEEQDEYLVTWTTKGFRAKPFMRMIEFDVEDREWILDKDMKEIYKGVTITAWQPLPEPYKAANNLPLCEDVIHGDFMGVMDKE